MFLRLKDLRFEKLLFRFDFDEPAIAFVDHLKTPERCRRVIEKLGMPLDRREHQQGFGVTRILLKQEIQRTLCLEPVPLEVVGNRLLETRGIRVGAAGRFDPVLHLRRNREQGAPGSEQSEQQEIPLTGRDVFGPKKIQGQQEIEQQRKGKRDGQKRPLPVANKSGKSGPESEQLLH